MKMGIFCLGFSEKRSENNQFEIIYHPAFVEMLKSSIVILYSNLPSFLLNNSETAFVLPEPEK